MRWLKDPNATLPYVLDFTDWLGSATIFSHLTSVTPTGLVVKQSGVMVGSKAVKIVLEGGTHGVKYKVQASITTDTGLTKEAEMNVTVKET